MDKKKSRCGNLDVSQGCLDGPKVPELMRIFMLKQIKKKYVRIDSHGIYRDDD